MNSKPKPDVRAMNVEQRCDALLKALERVLDDHPAGLTGHLPPPVADARELVLRLKESAPAQPRSAWLARGTEDGGRTFKPLSVHLSRSTAAFEALCWAADACADAPSIEAASRFNFSVVDLPLDCTAGARNEHDCRTVLNIYKAAVGAVQALGDYAVTRVETEDQMVGCLCGIFAALSAPGLLPGHFGALNAEALKHAVRALYRENLVFEAGATAVLQALLGDAPADYGAWIDFVLHGHSGKEPTDG